MLWEHEPQASVSYTASLLWNSLPEDMRNCKSLTTFKSKLKTFFYKRTKSCTFN